MSVAFERLVQHLEQYELRFETDTENETIVASFSGQVASYRVIGRIEADQDLFQVFGLIPIRVPKGCRPAVAETITRANFGLKVGNFEMDFDDGELRYQIAHLLAGDSLDGETVRRLIGTTMAMMDRYLPAILAVIYGNELPADAVRFAESDQEER